MEIEEQEWRDYGCVGKDGEESERSKEREKGEDEEEEIRKEEVELVINRLKEAKAARVEWREHTLRRKRRSCVGYMEEK